MVHSIIMSLKMCLTQCCGLCLQPVEDRGTFVQQMECLIGKLQLCMNKHARLRPLKQTAVVFLCSVEVSSNRMTVLIVCFCGVQKNWLKSPGITLCGCHTLSFLPFNVEKITENSEENAEKPPCHHRVLLLRIFPSKSSDKWDNLQMLWQTLLETS